MQRTKFGLTFKSNFTWAKTLDNASSTGTYTNHSSIVLNPLNLRQDWGPASFDTRKRFSFSGSYELPIGRGKSFWSSPGKVADKILSGWQLNTIMSIQSGLPLDAQLGFNQSRDGDTNTPDRPS